MAENGEARREPYEGPIELGMVFDFEPGKRHRYERVTIERKQGPHIWARGRCGQTFHEETEFRGSVVFVSPTPLNRPRPAPLPLDGRYEGPIDVGMVFDFEPAKKHWYERMTIERKQGPHIWARGRSGQTFHEENEFRDHVVAVPPDRR
jgi:hypothetical protein